MTKNKKNPRQKVSEGIIIFCYLFILKHIALQLQRVILVDKGRWIWENTLLQITTEIISFVCIVQGAVISSSIEVKESGTSYCICSVKGRSLCVRRLHYST